MSLLSQRQNLKKTYRASSSSMNMSKNERADNSLKLPALYVTTLALRCHRPAIDTDVVDQTGEEGAWGESLPCTNM